MQFPKYTKNLLITVIYAIFTLILVMHHEIWADEAQVWLLVKNLSVFGLFKHLVNEGHPSFFYLLMMPFAKMGFSALIMQIVCWLSMVISVFLLLEYSPFNKLAKFGIITSAGFLYFLPVIARSYSIIPLMVFALAIMYPKAKEHPYCYALLLACLANTHVIMFAFVFILGLYFVTDNCLQNGEKFPFSLSDWSKFCSRFLSQKSFVYSSLIILIGLIAVCVQLLGTPHSNIFIFLNYKNLFYDAVNVVTKFFIVGINSSYSDFLGIIPFSVFDFVLMIISATFYLLFFVILFKNSKKFFFLSFISVLFQFLIYIFAYSKCVYITRIFCAHIIILFSLWLTLKICEVSGRTRKLINVSVFIFLFLTFFNGIRYALLDFLHPYSGAKETAAYIEKNIVEENSIIVTDQAAYSISLIYYLSDNKKIYSIADRKPIKYIVWNKSMYHFLSEKGWKECIEYLIKTDNNFSNKKIFVVLTSFPRYVLGVKNPEGLKLIFESKPSVLKFENYRIYEYVNN